MEIKCHYRPARVKKYEARWYVEGRAKCRFFATDQERETFIENFSGQVARNGSDLVIIDASDFTGPPVARIALPQRVPYGFHGNWIAD